MNYSDIKSIIELANELNIDKKELFENVNESENDFTIEDYRFIKSDEIDEIQKDELKSDLYILGCFTDWFVADNTNIPLKAVEALQKAEAFEELGEMMLTYIEEIQEEYARLDGYGHHFAHYDHHEQEAVLNGVHYYYFKVN